MLVPGGSPCVNVEEVERYPPKNDLADLAAEDIIPTLAEATAMAGVVVAPALPQLLRCDKVCSR